MSTNVAGVKDATLQKLCDAVIACIRSNSGTLPAAAPNAFKDKRGNVLTVSDTAEVEIRIRISPCGMCASASVAPIGSKASAIVGSLDLGVLATKLV